MANNIDIDFANVVLQYISKNYSFQQLRDSIKAINNHIEIVSVEKIIKFLLTWKSLIDQSQDLSLEKVDLFVIEGIRFCQCCLEKCSRTTRENQAKIITGIKNVIRVLLSLANTYFRDVIVDLDRIVLFKITNSFKEISEVLTLNAIDLKLIVGSWNLVLKLIGDYNEKTSSNLNNLFEKQVITFFCSEFSRSLKLFQGETNEEPKKIYMIFKLSTFFLNSILQLCQISENIVNNEWDQILAIFKMFLNTKYKILKINADLFGKLNDYFTKIYRKMYRNPSLLQSLDGNVEVELLLETVGHLSEDPGSQSNEILCKFGLLDSLLESISKSDLILNNKLAFKATIETMIVLRVSQRKNLTFSKSFDNKISSGVVQKDSEALAIVCIVFILQRLRFMDPLKRERCFRFWMNFVTKLNVPSESIHLTHSRVLLKSIFDILPLSTKKRIFKSTSENVFLENLGIERVPDANLKDDIKNKITNELLNFFEDFNMEINEFTFQNFFNKLHIMSYVNLRNCEINDHVLKFLIFVIKYRECINCNIFFIRECIKFLNYQELKFRDDLIENMFKELERSDFVHLQFFNILIIKLLDSDDYKSDTFTFTKKIRLNNLSNIFFPVPVEDEVNCEKEMPFKRRKLDFTSTPLGFSKRIESPNGESVEKSLEKMCSQINQLKANLNRPLTNVETDLTKKIISYLQSIL